jgi:hypothetical protein
MIGEIDPAYPNVHEQPGAMARNDPVTPGSAGQATGTHDPV